MQEYQAIIEKFGEPFPTEGRRNPRVNPIFFAAAFQQDTQVKYFHDVGWLKMENGRWHSTSSTAIKIAIRDLILRLMRSTSKSCFSQITPGLLHEIMQMVQLENGAERFPPLDPDIIPVTNGILYWEPVSQELKFRDYNQEDIILDSLTVSYIPNAPAPLFEEKIREIIPDADDRRVVQDYLGASLFPANRTRKFLLFQGEGGCGKSLLVLLLSRLLGPTRVFDLNFKHISSTFGFSDLTTQTLLTASEAISGGLCSSGGELVKKITGGDYFQTAQKFQNDRVKHFGTFSLVLVTNNKMRIKFEGKGQEWKDRMLPILFHHHIPEEKQDRTLVDRLLTEEGSGILNWILDGARHVRNSNWRIELTATQKVRRDKLVDEIRSMDMFVCNYIRRSAGNEFSSRSAYATYIRHQRDLGLEFLEEAAFYKRFAKSMGTEYNAVGCNSIHGQKIRGYKGFGLLD